MLGTLVVLCGPSQMGKDHITNILKNRVEGLRDIICYHDYDRYYGDPVDESKPRQLLDYPFNEDLAKVKGVSPTIYKVRKRRESDEENIICVDSEQDIPAEFDIRYTIHNTQVVAYNSKEIQAQLEEPLVSFIVTGDIETSKKLKEMFGKHCLTVKVTGIGNGPELIAKEEAKRYNLDVKDSVVQQSAENRWNSILKTIDEVANFESDYEIRNYWTYPGGKYLITGSKYDLDEPVNRVAREAFFRIQDRLQEQERMRKEAGDSTNPPSSHVEDSFS